MANSFHALNCLSMAQTDLWAAARACGRKFEARRALRARRNFDFRLHTTRTRGQI